MEQVFYPNHYGEEIKQLVIGLTELRCRRDVEYAYIGNPESKIDWLEEAKRHAKHKLLDHIQDFILVTENDERHFVEAELYLPYVYDAEMKNLKSQLQAESKRAAEAERKISQYEVSFNKFKNKPWYKRVWIVLKGFNETNQA